MADFSYCSCSWGSCSKNPAVVCHSLLQGTTFCPNSSVSSVHEAPILWPPDVKSRFIWKHPKAGKDSGQDENGETGEEMFGWHHRLNGHGFEQTLGDAEGSFQMRVFCTFVSLLPLYHIRKEQTWPSWPKRTFQTGRKEGSPVQGPLVPEGHEDTEEREVGETCDDLVYLVLPLGGLKETCFLNFAGILSTLSFALIVFWTLQMNSVTQDRAGGPEDTSVHYLHPEVPWRIPSVSPAPDGEPWLLAEKHTGEPDRWRGLRLQQADPSGSPGQWGRPQWLEPCGGHSWTWGDSSVRAEVRPDHHERLPASDQTETEKGLYINPLRLIFSVEFALTELWHILIDPPSPPLLYSSSATMLGNAPIY